MNPENHVSDADATHQFSRANIISHENKIRLVDSDEESGLDLFCYVSCSNEEDDFVKQCRGLVFNGENLVMKAFSYTDEYPHDNVEKVTEVLGEINKWSFYNAYEGALLRMFFYSGRWFISTHRKLNAFRSKWASRDSFGTLFVRALESEIVHNKDLNNLLQKNSCESKDILDKFQSCLDKDKQYMFLLRNSGDNRIVCDVPENSEPLIFHVGTFTKDGLSMTENCGLKYPERHNFVDFGQVCDFVDKKIDPVKLQGIMCIGSNNRQVKILHRDYLNMFKARGNEPSINFRYLQVRMNKKLTEMLYKLYPERVKVFDNYENIIYDIARGIYRAYVQRFIKKNHVTVPREEYQVITQCHSWHLADREKNRISIDKVISVMNKQTPTNINHMIRRFKIEQTKKQMTVPRAIPGSRNNSAVNSPVVLSTQGDSVMKRLANFNLQ